MKHSVSPLPAATFQAFDSHLWLAALLLDDADTEHSCRHENWIGQHWLLPETLVQPVEFSHQWPLQCRSASDGTRPDLQLPLLWQCCVSVQMLHGVLTFFPRRKLAGYGRWSCLKNRMGWEFRLVEAEDQSAHLTLSLSPKWRKAVPLTGDWITLPFLCFLVLPSPAPGCWGGSQRPGDYSLQGRCWSMAGNQAQAVLIKYPSEHRKWPMGGATARRRD